MEKANYHSKLLWRCQLVRLVSTQGEKIMAVLTVTVMLMVTMTVTAK